MALRSPRTTYCHDNGRNMLLKFVAPSIHVDRATAAQNSMTDRNDANVTNVNGNSRTSPADLSYFHFAR